MSADTLAGQMVEYAPGTIEHCVGVVLRAWEQADGLAKRSYWLECFWDDSTIEGIDSSEIVFVEKVK